MRVKFKGRSVAVASLAEASAVYSTARDKSGLGGSRWPEGIVTDDGRVVGYVSYNGRVWSRPGREWQVGDLPTYDNRTAA